MINPIVAHLQDRFDLLDSWRKQNEAMELEQLGLLEAAVMALSASMPSTLAQSDKNALQASLERTKGNLTRTAKDLGVARSTVYAMIKRFK